MTTEPADPSLILAELLATRMAHDLAGLCGALQGALELAAEDPQTATEALPIARDGAAELARRLALLRAAWGGACEPLDRARLEELAAGLPGRRLRLDFSGLEAGAGLAPALARVVLNALLLGAETLRQGGTLALSGSAAAGIGIAIEGRGAAWPDSSVGAPDAAALADAGPRGVQALLLPLSARAAGLTLRVEGATLRIGARA